MRRMILVGFLAACCTFSSVTSRAQVTGGATVTGAASLNAACQLNCATGPLAQSGTNSHYLINASGKPVYLIGSGTWDDFQDIDQSASPAPFPFSTFVSMLKANNHNFTLLWHKDMPRLCGWQNSTNYTHTQFPWPRTGPGNASDGGLKWDLSQFNQAYFDRLRSELVTLYLNGIYAEVELFDTLDMGSYRCGTNTSPNGDGFPLTGVNNINSVNDGYNGTGSCGVGAFTMTTNNAVTDAQDAYVKKVLDTLNDLPNVIYAVGEEMPGTSFSTCSGGWGGASAMAFFIPHMIGLVKTYETGGTWEGITYPGKPFQHLVGIGSMNFADRLAPQGDAIIYGSTAQWISPSVTAGANTFPSNVSTNNQGKIVINDSDHALGSAAFVNASTGAIDDVNLRGYIWENLTNGASGMVFLDPYIVYLPNNQRNPCSGQVNGICTGPMTKYNPFRAAMGYTQALWPTLLNPLAMTPQPGLSSTGFALANNTATTSEFVVYSVAAASFTVNLSAQANRLVNAAWLDPTTGNISVGTTVTGGSATQSFTAPWGNAHDAVLHLTDGGPSGGGGAGNPQLPTTVGWFSIPNTNIRPLCPSYGDIQALEGCPGIMADFSGALFDSSRERFIIDGGGHNGYYGNEIYAINTMVNPMTRTLVHDATTGANLTGPGACGESNGDGTMNARHNYTGWQYMYWLDLYFQYGGSKANCGSLTNSSWYYNPTSNTWSQPSIPGTKPEFLNGSIPAAAYYWGDETHPPAIYDFTTDSNGFYRYDPVSQTWTQLASNINVCTSHTNLVAEIDPIRRIMIVVGQGAFCKILMDSPFTGTALAATNCTPKSSPAPGLKYDPVFKDFTLWNGGNTVYFYNPDTDSCTSDTTSTGGPGSAQAAGTYGRWNYDTQNGVYLAVNTIDTNVFAYRRATTAAQQNQDWTSRSTAAGVIAARGWDSSGDFAIQSGNTTGIHRSTSNSSVMAQDTTTYTSGGSSMKCIVPAQTGADACGSWWEFLSQTFGNNSTFYVQFRQKLDANVLAQNPKAGDGSTTYFKQSILATVISGSPSTCGNLELTTINFTGRGYPGMYSQCGADVFQVSIGGSDFLNEQGDNSVSLGAALDTGYNCHYQVVNNNAKSCATYPAGVWVTYYWKVQIGTFGSPNSSIQAWRALPGQPYQQFVKITNHTLNLDAGATGYSFVDLLNYYTNRNGGVAFGQTGATWYDELIVSTNPIPVPMAPVN